MRAFEVVACDTFVTEATFALPIYRWPPVDAVVEDLLAWIAGNRDAGRPTVLYAYSLGKAQRVLSLLGSPPTEPPLVHGAVANMTEACREAGVDLPAVEPVLDSTRGAATRGRLVIAPPSAMNTPWLKRFPDAANRDVLGLDAGARRPALEGRRPRLRHLGPRGLAGPARHDRRDRRSRVLATHGYADVLARACQERGLEAGVLDARVHGEEA